MPLRVLTVLVAMSVNASVDVRDSETDQGDRCVTGYIIVNDIII